MANIYEQLMATAQAAGLSIIGKWLAAKILYIIYAYGGEREEFTLSPKFQADMKYIQQTYGFEGGETPDAEVTAYIQQLYAENPTAVAGDKRIGEIPQWADELCKKRYGFNLIKSK